MLISSQEAEHTVRQQPRRHPHLPPLVPCVQVASCCGSFMAGSDQPLVVDGCEGVAV